MSRASDIGEVPKFPKYAGVSTFFGLPLVTNLDRVDIAVVGLPFDLGVTNRPGARHGPREIRNQSMMIRQYHQLLQIRPTELCRIVDAGDCPVLNAYSLEDGHRDIEAFYTELARARIVPLTAGGDHSITLPIFRALAKERPIGMLHFDAHCDTSDEHGNTRFHHGAPFRIAVEEGLLDPKRTVQIGIRGSLSDKDTWKFSHDSGMRVVYMDELQERGCQIIMAEARRLLGDGPAYLSFDVDGLDPAFAPGTGTPEVGGFTTADAQSMLRAARGLDFIGGDVVEVSPPFDITGTTALVGATILFDILCLLAESRASCAQNTLAG